MVINNTRSELSRAVMVLPSKLAVVSIIMYEKTFLKTFIRVVIFSEVITYACSKSGGSAST